MKITIAGQVVSQERLDNWEYRHSRQALKNLGRRPKPADNLVTLRNSLNQLKQSLTYEEILRHLGWKLKLMATLMRAIAWLSLGRVKYATCTLEVDGLTIEEFAPLVKDFVTKDSPGIRQINLAANPEHYVLEPRGQLFEVIETAGASPLPIQFLIDFSSDQGLVSQEDPAYPLQMVGLAYLAKGSQVGGIRHQFRNTETGMEARTLVEFPAACPSYIVKDHCLHLALEWKNWISAAQELSKG
ncbi:hypothetical protein QP168_03930 [Aerococcus urinae]|uniref:Uncharacterized protein n=1 Tax=Aerococcus mictus TaxID=2976810 RepID=A0A1E9PGI9_9LACT|nr:MULTISPECIES: hypothetical protein [Aerococcus]KAA9292159.1 hypothetical protein F6I06_03870 [Aerococcus mictus]MBU5609526.1 hypothetical protein [Aerococcus urinae]MCY3033544.1 hypothetical protein [Aerococcus mictus]MCY3062833.1 hypothetical protein [Aerococcus mictus]MCY3065347.1 hypothetical protein [Aerococcus mictus]